MSGEAMPSQSGWDEAMTVAVERSFTAFEGAELETLCWGRRGAPGMLLIHGFGAAADWWACVGPLLARDWRVVALSFSGNGRSGWRDAYDIDLYKREALACAEAGGALDAGPMAVVAHSFGATAGARLAAERADKVKAFVVVDRAIVQNKRRSIPSREAPVHEGTARQKQFSTREIALSHYQPLPAALGADPRLLHHIADAAIHEVVNAEGGHYWTWRNDPAMRAKLTERQPSIAPQLDVMRCARGFLHGVHSTLFLPEEVEIARALGMPVIEVPAAGHHLLLEQPVATATAIDTFLRILVPAGIGQIVRA